MKVDPQADFDKLMQSQPKAGAAALPAFKDSLVIIAEDHKMTFGRKLAYKYLTEHKWTAFLVELPGDMIYEQNGQTQSLNEYFALLLAKDKKVLNSMLKGENSIPPGGLTHMLSSRFKLKPAQDDAQPSLPVLILTALINGIPVFAIENSMLFYKSRNDMESEIKGDGTLGGLIMERYKKSFSSEKESAAGLIDFFEKLETEEDKKSFLLAADETRIQQWTALTTQTTAEQAKIQDMLKMFREAQAVKKGKFFDDRDTASVKNIDAFTKHDGCKNCLMLIGADHAGDCVQGSADYATALPSTKTEAPPHLMKSSIVKKLLAWEVAANILIIDAANEIEQPRLAGRI